MDEAARPPADGAHRPRRWSRVGVILVVTSAPVAIASCDLVGAVDATSAGGPRDGSVPGDARDSPSTRVDGADAGADAPSPRDADATAPPDDSNSPDANPPPDAPEEPDAEVCVAVEGPNPCDGGLIACNCNGAVDCVDPASDPNNCNGCGNVCGSGSCGTTIAADATANPTGWRFNGATLYDPKGPSVVLVPADVDQAGTFIFGHPVVVDDFDATFDFRIGATLNARSDGMGFMFERTGPSAVAGAGAALGMAGLDGYAAEIDIYDNNDCGDLDGNHIGVDSLALCSGGMPTSLFTTTNLMSPDLGDAAWHTVTVSVHSAAMTVGVDSVQVAASVSLPGFTPGTPYYFGLSGATGGSVNGNGQGGTTMEVRNVAIAFPTPRCL